MQSLKRDSLRREIEGSLARLGVVAIDLYQIHWFDISFMQKDLVLALDTARKLRVPLPSAATADELLTVARALGYEHRDLAALFEVLTQLAGDPARSRP